MTSATVTRPATAPGTERRATHPGTPGAGVIEAGDALLNAGVHYHGPGDFEAIRAVTAAGAWPDPVQAEIAGNVVHVLDAGDVPEIIDYAKTPAQIEAMPRVVNTRPSMQSSRLADELIADAHQRSFELRREQLALILPHVRTASEARAVLEEYGLTGETTAALSPFTDLSAWRDLAAAPVPWAFEGTIPDRAVTVIAAPGGMGKSLFAVGLGCSALLGREVYKAFRPAHAMPVLYLSGEDSAEMVCRRIAAYERVHHLHGLDAIINQDLHLRAQRPEPFLTMPTPGVIEETEAFHALLADVRRIKPGLVIIDTLRKHFGLTNENDNIAVGAFLEACAKLAREGACAVVVLAHTNKTGGTDPRATQTEVRGGSAVVDEARSAWVLKRVDGGLVLANVKQNYGPMHDSITLEFVDGALRETVLRRDPADLIEIVMGWFVAHPAAAVTRGGVLKGPGDGKRLCDAVTQHFPWADREAVATAVELALANRYLGEGIRKRSEADRHSAALLEIGAWPPDDTPF